MKNGHRIVRLPRYGIGQTEKSNVHLTENERQLLDDFQPELIYGKVRVQETRKFVPDKVLLDKKVSNFLLRKAECMSCLTIGTSILRIFQTNNS